VESVCLECACVECVCVECACIACVWRVPVWARVVVFVHNYTTCHHVGDWNPKEANQDLVANLFNETVERKDNTKPPQEMYAWDIALSMLEKGRVRIKSGVRYGSTTASVWYGEHCNGCDQPLLDVVNLGTWWDVKEDTLRKRTGFLCNPCVAKSEAWSLTLADFGYVARDMKEWSEWLRTLHGYRLNEEIFITSLTTPRLEFEGMGDIFNHWYQRYNELSGLQCREGIHQCMGATCGSLVAGQKDHSNPAAEDIKGVTEDAVVEPVSNSELQEQYAD
jgi:hypothetical protein